MYRHDLSFHTNLKRTEVMDTVGERKELFFFNLALTLQNVKQLSRGKENED